MVTKLYRVLLATIFPAAMVTASAWAAPTPQRPNVVIVFTDDQGYQDVGCFGSPDIKTPHLDRMAAEGMRFTDFHSAAPVCSASRAALMTGCYPQRVGITGVLFPDAPIGINPDETTIAEVLKSRGYATAIVGKWHLGDAPEFLPTRHGFDEYFGLPYSNDMHPPNKAREYPPLPLIRGEKAIETDPDQSQLTARYTQYAIDFIERHKDGPFFLYLPHTMPHMPIAASEKFKGTSTRGPYGDVIAEIDWSVGKILAAIKRLGLDEKTLVIFTADNGPWLTYGRQYAGSALPLREGKATTFEGGFREACIMRWPGQVPAGATCDELAATIDLLPTVAKLAGAEVPRDRVIDGKDIWPLMSGQKDAKSPHEAYAYYAGRKLQAVRSGRWKLHFTHFYPTVKTPGSGGKRGVTAQATIPQSLFDLKTDVGETTDVADEHPAVVKRLTELAERFRDDLGDARTGRKGKNARRPGRRST